MEYFSFGIPISVVYAAFRNLLLFKVCRDEIFQVRPEKCLTFFVRINVV